MTRLAPAPAEVLRILLEDRVLPIFHGEEPTAALAVMDACRRGGARLFELVHRGAAPLARFQAVAGALAARAGADLQLGIGTIRDAATAALYAGTGAAFVVSPILDEPTARLCAERGLAWIPGCFTPTEIARAEALGATVVKIFPAGALDGPAFFRAVLGASPASRLMPTGGVALDEANLRAWREAGAACVGLSSAILPRQPSGAFDLPAIEHAVRTARRVLAG